MIEPTPTYYALLDPTAVSMYSQRAAEARLRGSRVIMRAESPITDHVAPGGGYEPLTLSGLFCVEFAAKSGASQILMCGMCGYVDAAGNLNGYAPGIPGRVKDRGHTAHCYPQVSERLCRKYPGVQFVSVGRPHWAPERPCENYRVEEL
jgi:hypothetical protein